MGEAAALAVVGFGEIDELEVESEGSGKLISGGKVESTDAGECLLEMRGGRGLVGCSPLPDFGLATGDRGAAQGFDGRS